MGATGTESAVLKLPGNHRESQQIPVIPPKAKHHNLVKQVPPPPLPPKPTSNQESPKNMSHTKDAKENKCIKVVYELPKKHAVDIVDKKEHQDVKEETIQNTKKSKQCINQLKKEVQCTEAVIESHTESVSASHESTTATCDGTESRKCNPYKINAAEEIRACMQSQSEDSDNIDDVHLDFQAALQNFGGKKKGVIVTNPVLPKKMKVVRAEDTTRGRQMAKEDTCNRQVYVTAEQQSLHSLKLQCNSADQQSLPSNHETHMPPIANNSSDKHQEVQENKVVLREKKAKRETEDERRQRLSVHKDEIMRGNVKAAMEIFENLRKREELKIILSKVEEIEGETSEVDVRSLKNLFENVPAWIVAPGKNANHGKPKGEMNVEKTESLKDDTESMSSMEVVFGDLERASAEIINLKEQTLARLMDIEEAIKKALYSVSNLKSEADIAGLSGLFKESLNNEQSSATPKNIRKISIVSSKAKTEQGKEASLTNLKQMSGASGKSEEVRHPGLHASVFQPRTVSPSSPSFISIQSAARKPTETPKTHQSPSNTPQHVTADRTQSCHSPLGMNGDHSAQKETKSDASSPLRPKRKVSVLEVQTVPEAAGIVGTKTVSEKYEETDRFGNKFVTSKTSTIVTKQSETKTSSTYEVVANPTRYEVMTSPLIRRPARSYSENAQSTGKEGARVFVTFGHPKIGKH